MMDAQYEASDAANRGLDLGGGAGEDDEVVSSANVYLQEALVDVQDILEGAVTDVRGILGDVADEREEGRK